MSCRSELRGLGAVAESLASRGGRVLAVSVDSPETNARTVADEQLAFELLSDEEREAIRSYGLVHPNGLDEGFDIAIPAQLLVKQDGSVAWRHVAERVPDRAWPSDTLAAVEALSGGSGPP